MYNEHEVVDFFIKSRYKGVSKDRYDDLYQTAWMGLLKAKKNSKVPVEKMTLLYVTKYMQAELFNFLFNKENKNRSHITYSTDISDDFDSFVDSLEGGTLPDNSSNMDKEDIKKALTVLTDKEKYIIDRIFLSGEEATLTAIGDELNLTKERIRQLKESGLNKLRKYINE